MELITVSSRGQIVIPEAIREKLGLEKGTKLLLSESQGIITLHNTKDVEQLLQEQQQNIAWNKAGKASLEEMWDNEEDDIWNQYA